MKKNVKISIILISMLILLVGAYLLYFIVNVKPVHERLNLYMLNTSNLSAYHLRTDSSSWNDKDNNKTIRNSELIYKKDGENISAISIPDLNWKNNAKYYYRGCLYDSKMDEEVFEAFDNGHTNYSLKGIRFKLREEEGTDNTHRYTITINKKHIVRFLKAGVQNNINFESVTMVIVADKETKLIKSNEITIIYNQSLIYSNYKITSVSKTKYLAVNENVVPSFPQYVTEQIDNYLDNEFVFDKK